MAVRWLVVGIALVAVVASWGCGTDGPPAGPYDPPDANCDVDAGGVDDGAAFDFGLGDAAGGS